MKYLFFLIVCCLLLACGSGSQKNEEQNPKPPFIASEPTVLKSAYASSTLMPHEEYALEHLFQDNDQYWSTMLGAGPDEGIQLSFAEPTYLGAITIHPYQAENTAVIESVSLYADGQLFGEAENEKGGIKVNRKLSTLFIKIDSTNHISKSTRAENNTIVEQFSKTKRVAIRYLQITNGKGEVMQLLAPKRVKGKVEVSSTAEPQFLYSVNKLFDGKKETAWLGTADDNKREVKFYFENPVRVTDVEVWNGYQRSEQDFQKNGRVERFLFGTDNIYPQHIELEDGKEGQKTKMLTSHMGDMFGFRIKSVIKGTRNKEVGISEILFYDGYEPFVLETGDAEKDKKKRIEKFQNAKLTEILDTRIHNAGYDSKTGNYYEKSLIIRSDQTFTFYKEEKKREASESEAATRVVLSGNWEIINIKEGKITLRMFGDQVDSSTKEFEWDLIIMSEKLIGQWALGEMKR